MNYKLKNWYQIARNYLAEEKQSLSKNVPLAIAVFVDWKGQTYIGGIQEIAHGYDKEIVLLSKSSQPIQKELIKAIINLDKCRLTLLAEPILDLEGRLHILRRVENKLQQMTPNQMNYMELKQKVIIEENTGKVVIRSQPQRYIKPEDMGSRRN